MISFFKNKQPKEQKVQKIALGDSHEELLKAAAERFTQNHSIEIIEDKFRKKITPLKWLYPGYGEFIDHALVPKEVEKIATEVINEPKFVNEFLQNRRDIESRFGYFVARVEYNYVKLAVNGNKIFEAVRESDIDDYDTIVLVKQARRLLPKFNSETLTIDLKHIEVFGEVFNKLKSRLTMGGGIMLDTKLELLSIDIPTYSSTSIQIENSLQSYNIFKLSQTLERLAEGGANVSMANAKSIISLSLKDAEKVKDSLFVSENSKRYHLAIENLEKITNQLAEMDTLLSQISLK